MPDAIVDAIYYDRVVKDHCICSSVHDGEDGPIVVLQYVGSNSTVSVPLEPFKSTEGIEVRHLPDEPDYPKIVN